MNTPRFSRLRSLLSETRDPVALIAGKDPRGFALLAIDACSTIGLWMFLFSLAFLVDHIAARSARFIVAALVFLSAVVYRKTLYFHEMREWKHVTSPAFALGKRLVLCPIGGAAVLIFAFWHLV
jgi:hypothetical protein